jgi:hypothetical protein
MIRKIVTNSIAGTARGMTRPRMASMFHISTYGMLETIIVAPYSPDF